CRARHSGWCRWTKASLRDFGLPTFFSTQRAIAVKITPLVKLCILVAVGCGLYVLWHKGVSPHQEEPKTTGETEVAVHVGKISLATLHHGVTAYGTVEPERSEEHTSELQSLRHLVC